MTDDATLIAPKAWYSPSTGRVWTNRRKGPMELRIKPGKYHLIQAIVNKSYVGVHRLAWEAVNGPIPKGMVIDHINGNRSDNRICNLRVVEFTENVQKRKMSSNNTSGYPGVSLHLGRWRARLTVNGKIIYLKRCSTADEAYAAFLEGKIRYHGPLSIMGLPGAP